MTNEEIAELKSRMRAAQDAWHAAVGQDAKISLVAPMMRLEAQYRLAKQGVFRKSIPAGHVSCDRCGGYGGASQWPGFVCFKCDGLGSVPE